MDQVASHVHQHCTEYSRLIYLWTLFGIIHSIFASQTIKGLSEKYLPRVNLYYRLIYNFFAAFFTGIITAFTFYAPRYVISDLPTFVNILFYSIQFSGIIFFIIAMRDYDMADFLGAGNKQDVQALKTTGALGFVRHPFYLAGLLVIWFREVTVTSLITNLCLTLYIFIGIKLEEKRLIQQFGQAYRDYQLRVPMIFPRKPGKAL